MIQEQLLLVDGHNTLLRSFHAFKDLETADGRQLGALYGFLQSMIRLMGLHRQAVPIICFDGGRSERRMETFPEYKGNRKKDTEEKPPGFVPVYIQVGLARQVCEAMGIRSILVRGVEADDIMALLSRHSKTSWIYSTDKDFFQLIRPGHGVRRPKYDGGELLLDHENFHSSFKDGLSPLETRLHLAMMGDESDNIPGVPGVGAGTSPKILAALRSLPGYDDAIDPKGDSLDLLRTASRTVSRAKNVEKHWDLFLLSLSLVDLWRDDLITPSQWAEVREGMAKTPGFDPFRLQALFSSWDFQTSVQEIEWSLPLVTLRSELPFDLVPPRTPTKAAPTKAAPLEPPPDATPYGALDDLFGWS